MKKRLVFLCAIILLLALVTSSALAVPYAFNFSSVNHTLDTGSGKKAIGATKYSFKIDSGGTISNVNVLDARPRRAGDSKAFGSVHYYKSSGTFSHSYYSDYHNEGVNVFMRMEKSGSQSTSATPLEVSGYFTP